MYCLPMDNAEPFFHLLSLQNMIYIFFLLSIHVSSRKRFSFLVSYRQPVSVFDAQWTSPSSVDRFSPIRNHSTTQRKRKIEMKRKGMKKKLIHCTFDFSSYFIFHYKRIYGANAFISLVWTWSSRIITMTGKKQQISFDQMSFFEEKELKWERKTVQVVLVFSTFFSHHYYSFCYI